MKRASLSALFDPRSVALIGASSDPGKIGYRLAANLLGRPFNGSVYFVNPKGTTILGKASLRTIEELPEAIDLMILAVPKTAIMPSVRAGIRKRVRCIVALTAGFKETGDAGHALEDQLRELLQGSETRLVGPNCAGLADTGSSLHATIEIYPGRGRIAMVSQSGSLCSAFSSNIRIRQAGVSKYISLGNKVDVDEADLVEYLGEDEATACIALYIEDINDGRRLREVATRVCRTKPIVALKSGRTEEGARATYSHTGAMAGSDTLVEGALRQMGVLRADDLTQLYDLSAVLSVLKPLPGKRIAILSDAGGPGVIATDAAVQAGLEIPQLSAETKRRLLGFLPPFSSVQNPIDMTFTRDVRLYGRCILELHGENIDAVLVTIPSHFTVKQDLVSVLAEAKQRHGLSLVVAWLAADEVEEQRRELWKQGIPCFSDPRTAAAALGALSRYGQWLARRRNHVEHSEIS
ncbi:MAG: CoA-binding protein [Spirochaetaceae bacterium]|nr:MAG: CoA-binding protein [Spirochaetaceae bacterium]